MNIKELLVELEAAIVSSRNPAESRAIIESLSHVDRNSDEYYAILGELPRLCAIAVSLHKQYTVQKKWINTLVRLGIDIASLQLMGELIASIYVEIARRVNDENKAYDISNMIMDLLSENISDIESRGDILQKIAKRVFIANSSISHEIKERLLSPIVSEILAINDLVIYQIDYLSKIFEDTWYDQEGVDSAAVLFKTLIPNNLLAMGAIIVSYFRKNPGKWAIPLLSRIFSMVPENERKEIIINAFMVIRSEITPSNIERLVPIISLVGDIDSLLAQLTVIALTEKPTLVSSLLALVEPLKGDIERYMVEIILGLLNRISFPMLLSILYSELPPIFQEHLLNSIIQVAVTINRSNMSRNNKKGLLRLIGQGLLKTLGNEYERFIESIREYLKTQKCGEILKEWEKLR